LLPRCPPPATDDWTVLRTRLGELGLMDASVSFSRCLSFDSPPLRILMDYGGNVDELRLSGDHYEVRRLLLTSRMLHVDHHAWGLEGVSHRTGDVSLELVTEALRIAGRILGTEFIEVDVATDEDAVEDAPRDPGQVFYRLRVEEQQGKVDYAFRGPALPTRPYAPLAAALKALSAAVVHANLEDAPLDERGSFLARSVRRCRGAVQAEVNDQ